jgi:hypothetical protein
MLSVKFQTSLHKLVGYKEVLGWENQIQNSLAIQTHVLYSKSCLQVVLINRSSLAI